MIIEIGREYRGLEIGQLLEELSKNGIHKTCIVNATFFLEGKDFEASRRIVSDIQKTTDGFNVNLMPAQSGLCDWGVFEAFWTNKEGVKTDKSISVLKITLACSKQENMNIKRQNSPIVIGKEYRGEELGIVLAEIFEKGIARKFVFDVTYWVAGKEITTEKRNMVSIEKIETGFYIPMTPNRPNSKDFGEFGMLWFDKDDHKEDGTIAMLKVVAMVA